MLHTDAAQVRLQRLRTIVENKKVLGYGLVETLRLQTLRYINAYIFTRKASVRFCPQDGKEDRSPKKSVKIQEQGLARHSIHSFTLVNSIAETHFA